jgi:glycosyltransferase involved in cell wall biosynthesis
MKVNISAVIITFNEEKNIERCLLALRDVVDEIIVVDSYSTDNTTEIAKKHGALVIQRHFTGFTEQKNFALAKATYDHILSVDADEVLTEDLRHAIFNLRNNWEADGYCLNRLTNYCGRWIRHCGWYPEWKLRLWDRKKGSWNGGLVHETVKLKDASISRLAGDLEHYSYTSINQHIQQIIKFTDLGAEDLSTRKKKLIPFFHLVIYPFYTFLNKYFIQQGIRDGYYGFVISILTAWGKFLKYAKAIDKKKHYQ